MGRPRDARHSAVPREEVLVYLATVVRSLSSQTTSRGAMIVGFIMIGVGLALFLYDEEEREDGWLTPPSLLATEWGRAIEESEVRK